VVACALPGAFLFSPLATQLISATSRRAKRVPFFDFDFQKEPSTLLQKFS
jgi:hypothetical protein